MDRVIKGRRSLVQVFLRRVTGQEFFGRLTALIISVCISTTVALPIVSDDGMSGEPAPLNEKEKREFQKKVKKINKRIRERPCRDFLVSHLGEPIIGLVSSKLAEHQAFSGPRSKGIRAFDAGLYADVEISRIRRLTSSLDSPVATAASYTVTRSVADLFEDENGPNGRSIEAAVANYKGDPNTAFYRKLSAVRTLHEILHVSTALGDNELAVRLGIDITPFKGDPDLASDAITRILKQSDCD